MVSDGELECPTPKQLPSSAAESAREQHDEWVRKQEAEDPGGQGEGCGVGRKTILRSLEMEMAWVRKQVGARPTVDGGFRAENILVGVVQVVNQCGYSIEGWLGRRGKRLDRRAALKDIAARYHFAVPNKTLHDLLALAREVVLAAVWVEEFWVGALPIKEPRTISADHLQSLQEGRVRRRKKDQQERSRRLGEEESSEEQEKRPGEGKEPPREAA